MTSGPMPSPPITAMRKAAIAIVSGRGYLPTVRGIHHGGTEDTEKIRRIVLFFFLRVLRASVVQFRFRRAENWVKMGRPRPHTGSNRWRRAVLAALLLASPGLT